MSSRHAAVPQKARGRPPTYVWKSGEPLTESERRLKASVEKRRERQKKSYYKKKNEKSEKQRAAAPRPAVHASPDCLLYDYSGKKSAPVSSRGTAPLVVVREYYGYP